MAHLTIDERFKIYEMNKSGYSSRYIGTKIGRDKSTICYELKRMRGIIIDQIGLTHLLAV
uniref:helix-turn-helix domain-containing protein n=1 Tax=Rickettsia endosymbiont of Urophora cardui TaxID=3066265 RepID=UPI00313AE827